MMIDRKNNDSFLANAKENGVDAFIPNNPKPDEILDLVISFLTEISP